MGCDTRGAVRTDDGQEPRGREPGKWEGLVHPKPPERAQPY